MWSGRASDDLGMESKNTSDEPKRLVWVCGEVRQARRGVEQ